MSLITKISNLFAKTESSNTLGVAFRKDALACFFQLEEGEVKSTQVPIEQENYQLAVKSFCKQEHPNANVHLVLSAVQYQIVQVDKPNMPDDEINAALKWQIKDLVTIEPDNMIIDYFSGPVLAGGNQKINVVCAKKDELSAYVEMFEDSDLTLKSIITEEFAFANLIPKTEQAKLLLCQQPNEEIVILIVKDGNIHFHRRLRGYAQLGNKTPEELDFGSLDSLSLEIQRSMDYFERQLKQPPIQEVLLLLPIKTEGYIATRLAENTTASVNILSIDEAVLNNRAAAAAFGAVCLAANGGGQVNE